MSNKKMSKKAHQALLEKNTIHLFNEIKNHWTDEPVVAFLKDNEVDLSLVDNIGNTALHLMASRGYLDAIKIIVERGADVNAKNVWHIVPLVLPTKDKNLEICECLLNAGADYTLINKTIITNDKYKGLPDYYNVLLTCSFEMLALYMRYFKTKEDFELLKKAVSYSLSHREQMGEERFWHFDLMYRDDFLDNAKTMIEKTELNFKLNNSLKEKEENKQKKI